MKTKPLSRSSHLQTMRLQEARALEVARSYRIVDGFAVQAAQCALHPPGVLLPLRKLLKHCHSFLRAEHAGMPQSLPQNLHGAQEQAVMQVMLTASCL